MGLQDLPWEETVTIVREVGLLDRRCDTPVKIEVRWDSKTVAGTLLFSIVREVGVQDHR